MQQLPYYLGLPAWAYPGWKGPYFPPDKPALQSYARVFNAVEGNTTFYGIPGEETVESWRSATEGSDFRFSFKLPRSITHEARPSYADLRQFFARIEPLGENLGPFLVQLPATVGPDALTDIEHLLQRLTTSYRYVLEVRHLDFFAEPERLHHLLDEFSLGRVMLDSRPIYQGDRSHAQVQAALHAKPDVPVLDDVHGGIAFVRLILHPDLDSNDRWLDLWVERTRQYLDAGHSCYMMIHCPNNQHCPALAEDFHARLQRRSGPGTMPDLPPYPVPQQATLL